MDEQQAQLDELQPTPAPVSTTADPAPTPADDSQDDDDSEDTAELDTTGIRPLSDELVGAFAVYDDDLQRYTGPTFEHRADADDYRDELHRESGHVFVVHDL